MPDPLGEKYYGISPYSYCAVDPVNLVDPDGKEGAKIIDENGRRSIETNIVILTEPHLQTSDNMTEKQIRKIERRNRRIDAQNEFLVSSIKNGLREYYDDLHNSEGILIDFVFNYITVDYDGQNLRSLSEEYGIPAITPNRLQGSYGFGKALAVIIDREKATGTANGIATGPRVNLSDYSASTISHEIGHTFGLHHPSNGGVGIMAYPPEHLLPSQVDAIWSNSFEVR